ncbi:MULTISPECIES: amino acid adenylation domain-containing protein [unclassified Streptomyces]|uniref:amino acid adenylation domain-containing protein n=1 Tax=unclassified Streptomyces TaxID=2593676 RepID=UPI0013BEA544|nr:amino acid adenylation domain-containing protein [Streptomyces sp. CB09001]
MSGTPVFQARTGAKRPQGARAPASSLEDLVRSAVRLPSLAAKYERNTARGTFALRDLPVLTQEELAAATQEAIACREGDPGLLWAHGGTLEAPGLSLLPEGMFASEIHSAWSPLGPRDVVANLHPSGRLRPDHYFFNRFAATAGATVLPVGDLPPSDAEGWLALLARQGVTALAAPPQTMARLVGGVAAGRPIPWLRTLLLGGTTHDTTPDAVLADRFPYTDTWRLYGTPTSWVIGHHGPQCLADVYHPLPHQLVEVVDGRVLVTTLSPVRTPALIRYETRERAEFTHCSCGRRGPALRVLGPTPPSFRFCGRTIDSRELVALATACDEVEQAQVTVTPEQCVHLRVRLAPDAVDDHHSRAWVRYQVLEHHLVLADCVAEQPEAFEVIPVDHPLGASPLAQGEF